MELNDDLLLELTVEIVVAYASNNEFSANKLPDVIQTVHGTLREVAQNGAVSEDKTSPAVSLRRSVRPDAIVCMECGTEHKMIKRHLKTAHDLSVADYRDRWDLKPDYPLVAPNYARQRSELAKRFGLGRKKSK